MEFNYYFAFLILICMQKSVNSLSFKDIHDINSIKKFIEGISDKTPAEYQFGKVLTDNEKRKIIVDDLVELLENLNNLTDYNYNASIEFEGYVKIHRGKCFAVTKDPGFDCMDSLNAFDNISSHINSYATIIMRLKKNLGYDLGQYCPVIANITQNISLEKKGEILDMFYSVDNTRSYRYGPETNVTCGKRALTAQLFNKLSQQMITLYLKEYVIRYYLDIINSQCPAGKSNTRTNEFSIINKLLEWMKIMRSRSSVDSIYQCGPPNYEINKTFYQMNSVKTMIVKEEDLDGSCSNNCHIYSIRNTKNSTECQMYSQCRYIDSSFEICEVPDTDNSIRKYQWFKDGNGTVYGDNSTECKMPVKKVSSTLSITKFRWCDYCLCSCIKEKPSKDSDILFVSFRKQVTNIEKNMVVVGVRFVKKSHMIHVQIKEAKLKPNGRTGKSKWKELEDISYNKSSGHFYVNNDNGTRTLLEENVDYGRPEQIKLNSLLLSGDFVATGVAFQFLEHPAWNTGREGILRLTLRATPFDYFKGKVINVTQTAWKTKTTPTLYYFGPISISDSDPSTKSPKKYTSWDDEPYYEFVELQRSSLETDAGQMAEPLFDAQDVEGDPEFPLGGIGVAYRGRKGYGGFLVLNIYMIDTSWNFVSELHKK